MKGIEGNSFIGYMQGVNALSWITVVEKSSNYAVSSMLPLYGVLKASGYTHDRHTKENSFGTCVLEVHGGLQCSVHTDRHSKDNYILFPSIKLNCPNNDMARSQQYCCVLLQTIIELTVHFFTGGWNIKFDQILVLMLLHFASLPVFLHDRWICDHSTMTESHSCGGRLPWSWVQKLVLQNIIQCKSGKRGQTDSSQTHEWQVTVSS